jgi:hypothetical protein
VRRSAPTETSTRVPGTFPPTSSAVRRRHIPPSLRSGRGHHSRFSGNSNVTAEGERKPYTRNRPGKCRERWLSQPGQRTREGASFDTHIGDPLIDRCFGLSRIAPQYS